MVNSMTGFAARKGAAAGFDWAWDLRSVNGKGFDLRLKLPEGIDGLEPLLRAELAQAFQRGNLSLGLRVNRTASADSLRINEAALASVLQALHRVEDAALSADLRLAPITAADLLALRGVLEAGSVEDDSAPILKALSADLPALIAAFQAMRAAEGAALGTVIAAQIDRIAALTEAAARQAGTRRDQMARTLRENLARVLDASDGIDPARVAQELALLVVKADITEELDRLRAHVAAARALLAEAGQVGRKLDFLMQEFMREANTLCSKAGAVELTRIGLDLKVVIDQMREQVQNVE